MNYPKIIALYRLERNGMVYDFLNATTKKEARETIKLNGGIVYAILTMEEAYKLAYCSSFTHLHGFHGILNTKNDRKVEDVRCFLSQCFFYDNQEMVEAFEETTKIDSELAELEVKLAHYEAEVKFWNRLGLATSSVEFYQERVEKCKQEIQARLDKIRQEEEDMEKVSKEIEEATQEIVTILEKNNIEIVSIKKSIYVEFGAVRVEIKNAHEDVVEILKYSNSIFVHYNESTGFMSDFVEYIEGEVEMARKIAEYEAEEEATKNDMKNVEASLPNLGETNFMSDFERYMDMAYDLAWQEEEEEEELSKKHEEREKIEIDSLVDNMQQYIEDTFSMSIPDMESLEMSKNVNYKTGDYSFNITVDKKINVCYNPNDGYRVEGTWHGNIYDALCQIHVERCILT